MELLKLKITGTTPLMMHSDRLANPLHPAAKAHKELTSKRKKTEEDHEAIARSEFIAATYWDEASGFYVPGQNFDATFWAGAKLQKLGVHWKRGCLVVTDRAKLVFCGPRTPNELWADERFVDCRGVRVGQSKVMRYRPVFPEWRTQVEVSVNTDVIDIAEAKKAISDSGELIGVCEYRPRFGRFVVEFV